MVKGGMTLPVAPATERLAGKMQSKIIAIPIVRFEQIYCLHPLASPIRVKQAIAQLSKEIESLKDSNAKSKAPALVPIYREARRTKLSSLNKESKLFIPLLSLSGEAISRSLISQSIQAILLEKLGCCICC
jgi:hypothetical protein